MALLLLSFCVGLTAGNVSLYDIFSTTKADNTMLDVEVSNDYMSYSIIVNGNKWLDSGLTNFRNNGDWAKLTVAGTKKLVGNDKFGDYNELIVIYKDESEYMFNIHFKMYPNNTDLLVLSQSFPNGTMNSAVGNRDEIMTSFPSIKLSTLNPGDLGYVHFQGSMSGDGTHVGGLNPSTNGINGGLTNTSPLGIFNADNCIIISALTDHMAINDGVYTDSNNNKEMRWGLLGNISSVPKDYVVSFIISSTRNNGGPNEAMMNWGDRQLRYNGNKERGNAHSRDYALQYLGYSTDNGAYYYYWTEPGKNYQDTMIDVKKYTVDELGLPVKYWLMDSWWYYKGNGGGVKNWTAMPNIFPDGIEYVYKNTGWKIQAHNRYYSTDNVYLDLYPFTCSTADCLPTSEAFWEYLFDINENWGLITYEQDWESTSESDTPLLYNTTYFGKEWLTQMNNAAINHGLSIQYCMDYPRHLMTSAGLNAVTQARASDDYHPGSDQWIIGLSSIFTWAIDIAPSKDSYWSMPNATVNKSHYSIGTSEPYNRLQSLVLSLSNGPVTFADQIGLTNKELIMKSCNNDGLLLRPDKPATMIDSFFYLNGQLLVNNKSIDGPQGQLWSTYSIIGNRYKYIYAFGAKLNADYNLKLYDIETRNSNALYLGYEYNSTNTFIKLDSNSMVTFKKCNKYDFQYYTFIPINPDNMDGWYLQGELSKWITVSKQRFIDVNVVDNTGSIKVLIKGAQNEKVNVAFVQPSTGKQQIISCVIDGTLQAVIRMPAGTCQPY